MWFREGGYLMLNSSILHLFYPQFLGKKGKIDTEINDVDLIDDTNVYINLKYKWNI